MSSPAPGCGQGAKLAVLGPLRRSVRQPPQSHGRPEGWPCACPEGGLSATSRDNGLLLCPPTGRALDARPDQRATVGATAQAAGCLGWCRLPAVPLPCLNRGPRC